MLSVTERINTVHLPRGGYLAPSCFTIDKYTDGKSLYDIPAHLRPIQGSATDYLVRYFSGTDKREAFFVSLQGAEIAGRTMTAEDYLQRITNVNEESAHAACMLVQFDCFYRHKKSVADQFFELDLDEKLIKNVIILTERCLSFFAEGNKIRETGFTFEGGYTELVSSGDGDYLTDDAIWDLKVSDKALTSRQTLQILMYYIMGVHADREKYDKLKKLGIFNPWKNEAYHIQISKIPETVLQKVNHDVLGYSISSNSNWKNNNGFDKAVLREYLQGNFTITDFDPTNYSDGKYVISPDDYWTFYSNEIKENALLYPHRKPFFPYTDYILMLKKSGYYMFISISKNKMNAILYGARRKKLKYPIEYYYDNLDVYAHTIKQLFSGYWDRLYEISRILKGVVPEKTIAKKTIYKQYCKETDKAERLGFETFFNENVDTIKFSGAVHGCIVDFDFYNHLYINPFDGKVTAYTALSTTKQITYDDIGLFVKEQRPEMLPGFYQVLPQLEPFLFRPLSSSEQQSGRILLLQGLSDTKEKMEYYDDEEYNTEEENESKNINYSTNIYVASRILKKLQFIYDRGLVVDWIDGIVPEPVMIMEQKRTVHPTNRKNEFSPSPLKMMQCGMEARIITANNLKDVTVQFVDGTIIEHVTAAAFRKGTVKNPNIQ